MARFTAMFVLAGLVLISNQAKAQSVQFDITATVAGNNSKVTATLNSYSFSFDSYQLIVTDSSKMDPYPYSASLLLKEINQDLIRVLAGSKKISVIILKKEKNGTIPMVRKFEFKNAFFSYAERGSKQDGYNNDEAVLTLKCKELAIDGIEIKQ